MTSPVRSLHDVDAFKTPELLAPRIAHVHHIPLAYAHGLVREAKRMLHLAAIQDEPVAPSDRVDWAWHEMLMCTRWYKEFAAYIGAFIHHDPNPIDSTDDPEETWEKIQSSLGTRVEGTPVYDMTKRNYAKYLGVEPDPLYWP